MKDRFNLTGLSEQFPRCQEALRIMYYFEIWTKCATQDQSLSFTSLILNIALFVGTQT
jgi:hypothetical protein